MLLNEEGCLTPLVITVRFKFSYTGLILHRVRANDRLFNYTIITTDYLLMNNLLHVHMIIVDFCMINSCINKTCKLQVMFSVL